MRSQLGETFRTLELAGQVVARSDSSAIVNFGQVGFLSVMTDCAGNHACVITLAIPRTMLEGVDIADVKANVLSFFDIRSDTPCCVRTCEPVQLSYAPYYAGLVEPPYADVYSVRPLRAEIGRVEPPKAKIYSVPRRYDLASLFSISFGYAILFTTMRALAAPPVAILTVAGFFLAVGIAQAMLCDGNQPRAASMFAGSAYALVGIVLFAVAGQIRLDSALNTIEAVAIVIGSPIAGYLAGTTIGGLWLIADYLRQWLDPEPATKESDETKASELAGARSPHESLVI